MRVKSGQTVFQDEQRMYKWLAMILILLSVTDTLRLMFEDLKPSLGEIVVIRSCDDLKCSTDVAKHLIHLARVLNGLCDRVKGSSCKNPELRGWSVNYGDSHEFSIHTNANKMKTITLNKNLIFVSFWLSF